MLRITEEVTTENIKVLRLEGRLVDEWVTLLQQHLSNCSANALAFDLSGLSYGNQAGLELLLECQTQGARLNNASFFLHEMLRQTAAVVAQRTPKSHIAAITMLTL